MFVRPNRHNGHEIGQFKEPHHRWMLFAENSGSVGAEGGAGAGTDDAPGGDGGDPGGTGEGGGSATDGAGDGGTAGTRPGGIAGAVAAGQSAGGDSEGGEGEGSADGRPDNLPDQFWDGDAKAVKTDALIKSHNDTKADRDRLANLVEKDGEAPKTAADYFKSDLVEDGHLKLPEGEIPGTKALYPDGVPTDDPFLVKMAENALKRGISRASFLGFVGDFLLEQDQFIPQAIDIEAETGKLGKNGTAIVEAYTGWVTGLQTNGVLSAEDVTNMLAFGGTASEIQTLRKIQGVLEGRSNVDLIGDAELGEGLPSKAEWYANVPPPGAKPDVIAKWQEQGAKLFGTGSGGTSQPGMGMPASHGAATPAKRLEDQA